MNAHAPIPVPHLTQPFIALLAYYKLARPVTDQELIEFCERTGLMDRVKRRPRRAESAEEPQYKRESMVAAIKRLGQRGQIKLTKYEHDVRSGEITTKGVDYLNRRGGDLGKRLVDLQMTLELSDVDPPKDEEPQRPRAVEMIVPVGIHAVLGNDLDVAKVKATEAEAALNETQRSRKRLQDVFNRVRGAERRQVGNKIAALDDIESDQQDALRQAHGAVASALARARDALQRA